MSVWKHLIKKKSDEGLAIEYLSGSSDQGTNITFSSVGLGAPNPGRRIIVAVHYDAGGARTLTMTIGGVAATAFRPMYGHNGNGTQHFWATVPTGTTGDIVCNFDGFVRCRINVYRSLGWNALYDFGEDKVDSSKVMDFDLDIPAGDSIVIGTGGDSNGSGQDATWTAGFTKNDATHYDPNHGFVSTAHQLFEDELGGLETCRMTFTNTPAGGWENGQSICLKDTGTLELVGWGYHTQGNATPTLDFGNVVGGVAPSAGDFVVCSGFVNGSSRTLPTGWNEVIFNNPTGYRASTIFIDGIPQSDLDTPPSFLDGGINDEIVFWMALRKDGNIAYRDQDDDSGSNSSNPPAADVNLPEGDGVIFMFGSLFSNASSILTPVYGTTADQSIIDSNAGNMVGSLYFNLYQLGDTKPVNVSADQGNTGPRNVNHAAWFRFL